MMPMLFAPRLPYMHARLLRCISDEDAFVVCMQAFSSA